MKMYSKGYTLWLQPKGDIYKKFDYLIRKIASKLNGPIFQPHVTLLGEISIPEEEICNLSQLLVQDQKPFTINLNQIGYEDFHFRTLFVKAEVTAPLLKLHQMAKKLFDKENIPLFMPHLSLLYGNYPPGIKEVIIREIDREQKARFEVNSITLIKGGEVSEWKVIGNFTFS